MINASLQPSSSTPCHTHRTDSLEKARIGIVPLSVCLLLGDTAVHCMYFSDCSPPFTIQLTPWMRKLNAMLALYCQQSYSLFRLPKS
ncbi:hypothetical protein PsorP6_002269 [Peronosclerospora sorghi]|uniref:Uncharacterized protein n=1 Tax=Peronosclerospora sorghi TaxID=230839 RepID=A0ACC0WW01_9STRA|nr:hypothetical protein PsorP6_002269 [Peronosclerospora sorghi]